MESGVDHVLCARPILGPDLIEYDSHTAAGKAPTTEPGPMENVLRDHERVTSKSSVMDHLTPHKSSLIHFWHLPQCISSRIKIWMSYVYAPLHRSLGERREGAYIHAEGRVTHAKEGREGGRLRTSQATQVMLPILETRRLLRAQRGKWKLDIM